MVTLREIEVQAMLLPDADRAVPDHEDDGVAEALRRDVELDLDSMVGLSLHELRLALGR